MLQDMRRESQIATDEHEQTLTGATIAGRYQVIGSLGSGGIGQVYAAEQIGLDRQVAVKVIRKGRRGDDVTEKRFMREARAAGRISSPHVVTLFDFGRDPQSGLLYLAMELLEGQSLSQRLDDPTLLEMPELLRVGASVARGLRAAHEAGVLHRDLKPANVFLCSDKTVKVLDFGIAKLMDDEQNDWEPLTQVNRILGTPVYMSPEAATRRPLGPTSDLYALGLILFEMVVGEPPFKTGNAMKTLRAQVETPAPRLSDAAPWRPIPEELDDLVAQLLEKDPNKRPRDAGDVVERIEQVAAKASSSETVVDSSPLAHLHTPARTEVDIPLPARTPDVRAYVAYGEDDEEEEHGAATTVWGRNSPSEPPKPATPPDMPPTPLVMTHFDSPVSPSSPPPISPAALEPRPPASAAPSPASMRPAPRPRFGPRELALVMVLVGAAFFALVIGLRILFG
ncbi:MAG: serine/threonine-protein kinase [Sandaracinaceae bacterium]